MPVEIPVSRTETLRRPASIRQVWLLAGVVVSGVAATLFGINDYSAASSALTGTARRNSQRFEAVQSDAVETRLSALRLGVDLVVANPEITGAFARDDRDALMRTALPLFTTVLQPRYNTNQFNFWTPPAKLFLRSSDPKEFGTDGTAARRSIVTATERRAPLAGMETGLGGRIAIRAIAPVMDGTRLVGVVELGDDLVAILRRTRGSTGVEFAAGLDRKRSDEVERIPDKAADSIQGTDVFFEYSTEEVGRLVRGLSFNLRDPAGKLIQADGRAVFVRPFIITNLTGVPTVVVTTIFDLTRQFQEARQSAAIKACLLFVVLSIVGVVGLLQFQKVQQGFARVVFGEQRKLQETTRALDAARQVLKDVELVKQGFFTNMVAAVSEPLQGVYGQLQLAVPAVDRAFGHTGEAGELSRRLVFARDEIGRLAGLLAGLLADYRKVELFRQKLVRDPAAATSLAAAVSGVLGTELARFGRLPQLTITAQVPDNLPPVRVSPDLLRYALAGLVGHPAENGGVGRINIVGTVDEVGWVKLGITGSAFAAAGLPTQVLLDDARQFIARLSGPTRPPDANGTMMALVLARTIVENAGGQLDAAPAGAGEPGFVMLLPAAA